MHFVTMSWDYVQRINKAFWNMCSYGVISGVKWINLSSAAAPVYIFKQCLSIKSPILSSAISLQ